MSSTRAQGEPNSLDSSCSTWPVKAVEEVEGWPHDGTQVGPRHVASRDGVNHDILASQEESRYMPFTMLTIGGLVLDGDAIESPIVDTWRPGASVRRKPTKYGG